MENETCHRIAVLADTHDLLRPEVTEILRTCEIILHGGDLSSPKILEELERIDLFIYGHSHKYEQKTEEGVCFLNPGSCGPRRFRLPVTMAVLKVQEGAGTWKIERVDLTDAVGTDPPPKGLKEENLEQTAQFILRDMAAGRKVEAIARRLGLDREFVEQVCRIYVTHPGVDAQGIVNKMEVNALFGRRPPDC